MSGLLQLGTWVPILDGDPIAAAMYDRHYSSARSRERRTARGTLQFGGAGNRMVLMTPCRRALWVWRAQSYRKDAQRGIECSIFRNEGPSLASSLVRAADEVADQRWPGVRHFTFVDEHQVRGDPPGNCFLHAGWSYQLDDKGERARSKERGLLILERMSLTTQALAA